MPSPAADWSDALHARVRAAIAGVASDAVGVEAAAFDTLALAIARFQRREVPAFARLCAARGIDLDAATSADVIPAVPTDVFRLARVAAHPPAEDARVFLTSGTTSGARGRHPLRTTATYAAAALAWGAPHLWPDRAVQRVIVLAPSGGDDPGSSLSFMIDLFVEHLGVEATWHVDRERAALDSEGLARACAAARRGGAPVLLLGTSFAFVWATDEATTDLRLPPGSRAMITGGFKGKTREIGEAELRSSLAARFALASGAVVGEYGMTELSSQLYQPLLVSGAAGGDLYRAPPWLRVTAVDPVSLAPVPAGEEGIARFVDLANVDSAVAVQTADRIRVLPQGIALLGRAPGATPRGCSIAIDEMRG